MPAEDELSRATRSLACGLVLFGYAVLGLGLVVGLNRTVLAALFVGPMLWPGHFRQVCLLGRDAMRELSQRLDNLGLGVSALVLGAIALCGLTPNTHFDVQSYHYAIPEIYLRQGSLDWCWTNFFEGLVQSVHMLYLAAMGLGGEYAANLLNAIFLWLLLLAAIQVTSQLEPKAVTANIVLLVSSSLILFQGIGGLVDLPLATYALLALGAFLGIHGHSGNRLWLAFWCGAALSCKITAIAPVTCLLLSLGYCYPGRWRYRAAGALAIMSLMALPWWVRNYFYTGDPLYPLLGTWRLQTFDWNPMSFLIPAAHAQSSRHEELTTVVRTWPGLRALQNTVNLLIWSVPLLLLGGMGRRLGDLKVPLLISILPCAALCSQDVRYAMPFFAWWSIVAAILWVRARQRWPRLSSFALGLSCLPGCLALFGLLYQRLPVVSGLRSKEAFLEQRSPYSAFRFLERFGRPGQRVVLLGRLGYRCSLEYLCADALPIQQWLKFFTPGVEAPRIDYFAVDFRERMVLHTAISMIRRPQQERAWQPQELCVGPLRGLTPHFLEQTIVKNGLARETPSGLEFDPLDLSPRRENLERFLSLAWNSEILFQQDGVLVLGPPGPVLQSNSKGILPSTSKSGPPTSSLTSTSAVSLRPSPGHSHEFLR